MGRAHLTGFAAAFLLALAGPAATASAALDADSLYEPTTVVAIDLQLPQASVEALEADPGEYVEGTFALAESGGTPATVGEPSAPLVVGVRLKGTASFRDLSGKAAFKVKFNEFVGGQKFLGLKSLTLNNMVQDPSMIREALSYEAFRAAGVAAPGTGYAYVRLNGVAYGLYLNLETMDDVWLKRVLGDFDDPQHLYEGQPFLDILPGNAPAFEVDEGDEDDRSDLEALIAAAAAEAPGFSERMAPVADLDQMTTMWAAERYLGHWDGYTGLGVNNYYLLSDPAGAFQMLPWGTDQALHHWWHPFGSHPIAAPGGTLFRQCLAEEACAAAYRAALSAVAESTTALDPSGRARQLAALLAPWQAAELTESVRAPFDAAAIERGVADVLAFLERRPAALAKWLSGGGEPEPPTEPGSEGDEGPGRAGGSTPEPVGNRTDTAVLALSGRLAVDRARIRRGLLLLRVPVPGPGTLSHRAEIVTAAGRIGACAAALRTTAAGPATLACQLSANVRRRLAIRWLRLRVQLRFQPPTGPAATQRAVIRLAREASGEGGIRTHEAG